MQRNGISALLDEAGKEKRHLKHWIKEKLCSDFSLGNHFLRLEFSQNIKLCLG